jgi:hypothetical protein
LDGIDLKQETNRQASSPRKTPRHQPLRSLTRLTKEQRGQGNPNKQFHSKQVKKAKQQKLANTHTHKLIYDTNIQRGYSKTISSNFVSAPYLSSLPSCSCRSVVAPPPRPPATEEVAVEERGPEGDARLRRLSSHFFHFLVILFLLSLS